VDQQQNQINQAAEKFAEGVRDSYQAVADRAVSAQELNAELTQQFFNGVINNLQQQAESNRQTSQQLADETQRQQEATQQLTQEPVGTYMAFIDSMFAFYQQGIEQTQQQARRQGT
jgi:hypothetical protein